METYSYHKYSEYHKTEIGTQQSTTHSWIMIATNYQMKLIIIRDMNKPNENKFDVSGNFVTR